jgi:hypothetical protein
LAATTVNSCIGQCSGSATGLYAFRLAIGCYGTSGSGTGLIAVVANFCLGSGSPDYSVGAKYNMP